MAKKRIQALLVSAMLLATSSTYADLNDSVTVEGGTVTVEVDGTQKSEETGIVLDGEKKRVGLGGEYTVSLGFGGLEKTDGKSVDEAMTSLIEKVLAVFSGLILAVFAGLFIFNGLSLMFLHISDSYSNDIEQYKRKLYHLTMGFIFFSAIAIPSYLWVLEVGKDITKGSTSKLESNVLGEGVVDSTMVPTLITGKITKEIVGNSSGEGGNGSDIPNEFIYKSKSEVMGKLEALSGKEFRRMLIRDCQKKGEMPVSGWISDYVDSQYYCKDSIAGRNWYVINSGKNENESLMFEISEERSVKLSEYMQMDFKEFRSYKETEFGTMEIFNQPFLKE